MFIFMACRAVRNNVALLGAVLLCKHQGGYFEPANTIFAVAYVLLQISAENMVSNDVLRNIDALHASTP